MQPSNDHTYNEILPFLQFMAFFRSLTNGLNLDRPNHLTAVVKLDF